MFIVFFKYKNDDIKKYLYDEFGNVSFTAFSSKP